MFCGWDWLIISRLTQAHDVKYLAQVTASCLKWFGLGAMVIHAIIFCQAKTDIESASFYLYGQC